MFVLLTNDDGYDAVGLNALREVFSDVRMVVVAPATEQSECGHRVTTKTKIQLEKVDENNYKVHGTPADCVRIGLTQLFPDVTHVVSGINFGANLGADQYISGTVAAAREAVFLGKESFAVSQYFIRGMKVDWKEDAIIFRKLFEDLKDKDKTENSFYNINFPCLENGLKGVDWKDCKPDTSPLPVSYAIEDQQFYKYNGVFASRKKTKGSDVDVCFSGKISVSIIQT